MKKAKIMLSALTLLAIAGGALAFKAKNYTGGLKCSTTITTSCPVRATTNGTRTFMYCTFTGGTTCSVWLEVEVNA